MKSQTFKGEFWNAPRVAAVITDGEDNKALTSAKRNGADILEIRIDCFKSLDADYLKQTIKKIRKKNLPILATIRSREEGGKSSIIDRERLKLFEYLIPLVDAVDIELSSKKIIKTVVTRAREARKKVIVSCHNFKRTPESKKLESIIENSRKAGADIVKIAAFARDRRDLARLACLTARHENIVVIAMGEIGKMSRVFFPMLGSRLTYCSVTGTTAPGQMSLKDTVRFLKEFTLI